MLANNLIEEQEFCGYIADEKKRSCALANIIALKAAFEFFGRCGLEPRMEAAAHRIRKVFEELDISDLYIGGLRLDVRLGMASQDVFLIPCKHYEFGVTPDLYMFVDYDDTTGKTEVAGFLEPEKIDKSQHDDYYYIVSKNKAILSNNLEVLFDSLVPKAKAGLPLNCKKKCILYLDNLLLDTKEFYSDLMNYEKARKMLLDYCFAEDIIRTCSISLDEQDLAETDNISKEEVKPVVIPPEVDLGYADGLAAEGGDISGQEEVVDIETFITETSVSSGKENVLSPETEAESEAEDAEIDALDIVEETPQEPEKPYNEEGLSLDLKKEPAYTEPEIISDVEESDYFTIELPKETSVSSSVSEVETESLEIIDNLVDIEPDPVIPSIYEEENNRLDSEPLDIERLSDEHSGIIDFDSSGFSNEQETPDIEEYIETDTKSQAGLFNQEKLADIDNADVPVADVMTAQNNQEINTEDFTGDIIDEQLEEIDTVQDDLAAPITGANISDLEPVGGNEIEILDNTSSEVIETESISVDILDEQPSVNHNDDVALNIKEPDFDISEEGGATEDVLDETPLVSVDDDAAMDVEEHGFDISEEGAATEDVLDESPLVNVDDDAALDIEEPDFDISEEGGATEDVLDETPVNEEQELPLDNIEEVDIESDSNEQFLPELDEEPALTFEEETLELNETPDVILDEEPQTDINSEQELTIENEQQEDMVEAISDNEDGSDIADTEFKDKIQETAPEDDYEEDDRIYDEDPKLSFEITELKLVGEDVHTDDKQSQVIQEELSDTDLEKDLLKEPVELSLDSEVSLEGIPELSSGDELTITGDADSGLTLEGEISEGLELNNEASAGQNIDDNAKEVTANSEGMSFSEFANDVENINNNMLADMQEEKKADSSALPEKSDYTPDYAEEEFKLTLDNNVSGLADNENSLNSENTEKEKAVAELDNELEKELGTANDPEEEKQGLDIKAAMEGFVNTLDPEQATVPPSDKKVESVNISVGAIAAEKKQEELLEEIDELYTDDGNAQVIARTSGRKRMPASKAVLGGVFVLLLALGVVGFMNKDMFLAKTSGNTPPESVPNELAAPLETPAPQPKKDDIETAAEAMLNDIEEPVQLLDTSVSVTAMTVDCDVPSYMVNTHSRRYLIKLAKRMQLQLRNALLIASEQPLANKIIIDLSVDKDVIKYEKISSSSGSKKVDELAISTTESVLKNTQPYAGTFGKNSGIIRLVVKF